jgi:GNAT superfamily N-acetyltransferase
MERFAYLIKHRFPGLFRPIAGLAGAVTVLRYGLRRERALSRATLVGTVSGQPAEIRPLRKGDAAKVAGLLAAMPEENLQFFRPHGFDAPAVERVLRSRAFMIYGLFVERQLSAYALLRLAPTGSAFIGLLVAPPLQGRGLGRFLVHYLYWQASVAGFRVRSTISQHNTATIRAHQAVADYRVVAALPNDYLMIEFPPGMPSPPRLEL